MSKRLLLILAFMVFFIAACAGVDPKTLPAADTNAYILVTHDMTYSGKRRSYGFVDGIKKGTYKAEYQDSSGTYFRGPPKCTITTSDYHGITRIREGGVWIPKNWDMKQARIYSYFSEDGFYEENPDVKAGVLSIAMIHGDDGKIFLWPIIEDANFLAELKQQIVK